jgi:hypothetical protein
MIRFLGNYGSWESIAPMRNFPGAMLSQAIFHRTRDLLGNFSQEISPRTSAMHVIPALASAPKPEE